MRKGLLAIAALTACGSVLADPPPQQVVEDLNELHQQFSPSSSSQAEFAQAIRDVAEKRQAASGMGTDSDSGAQPAQAWIADDVNQPAPGPWSAFNPPTAPPDGQVIPVNDERPAPPQFYQPGPPATSPHYGPPHYGPPPGPYPGPHGGPHPAPKPPRSPQVLLQDTAFDLERMAHELDKVELYGEADTLRGAAGRLRQTARQHRRPGGSPHPSVADRPGPAPVEHSHAAERARRAIQEANERVQQSELEAAESKARFQRQLRQLIDDEAERVRDKAFENGRRLLEEAREGPQRPRDGRRERPDRPDRYRPDLPPPGVHGGPTDPPPPPQLAPGQ